MSVHIKMKKNTISFRIDTRWCLDELLKDGRISQRDANLVATTPRRNIPI